MAINTSLLTAQAEETGQTSNGGGSTPSTCRICGGHSSNSPCPFKDRGFSRTQAKKLATKAKAMSGKFDANAKKVIEDHVKDNGEPKKE